MKLLIIGHGRHGKDTVSEIIREYYNLTFISSSKFCSEHFIFNRLKDVYGYKNEQECYDDRHNRRKEWYELISDYCSQDPSLLGREILSRYDIYCGLRNKKEFHSLKNQRIFDYAIWVDRSDHLPLEDKSSMSLEPWMADYIIDNNGTLDQLTKNTHDLMYMLEYHHFNQLKVGILD